MKTENVRNVRNKLGQKTHQNLKSNRRPMSVLQQTAADDNLVGRTQPDIKKKIIKFKEPITQISSPEKPPKEIITFSEKAVQTCPVNDPADLTSDEPSVDYWKRLAEKRAEYLEKSLQENEKLRADIKVLQEENKISKAMLEEATTLVEILKETLDEDDNEDVTTEESEKLD